ncbi:hypothetical protein FRC07_012212, partial [Ceratobasidium sp. 392]
RIPDTDDAVRYLTYHHDSLVGIFRNAQLATSSASSPAFISLLWIDFSVFGLRATSPITFLERGLGIESLVDVLAHYLEGDYTEKPVLEKWLDDLVDAATTASSVASTCYVGEGAHTLDDAKEETRKTH